MLKKIDNFLNAITMYRLLAYGLSLLALVSFIFSFTNTLSLSWASLAVSLSILLAGSYVTNKLLGIAWQAPTNNESWFITALILFFVMPPATTVSRALLLLLASIIAMASKFMIAAQRKHIFNPAAFAAATLGISGLLHPAWWIGSSTLWPFALALGLLVLRKIRRAYVFISFVAASLLAIGSVGIIQGQAISQLVWLTISSSPLIFLGTIMLTEPATMPSRKHRQVLFAIIVGTLYALHWNIFGFYIYPEVALLIGNIYAYAMSPRYRLRLRLAEIRPVSEKVADYVFIPERQLSFIPGQYLEWTLPHNHQDTRGNRRTFTIASSPTEKEMHLGVKFYEPSSSYKKALHTMQPGDSIYAGQLAGNFILPTDPEQKLVFIAGGIGITPFRSMIKYLVDTNQQRDIVLIYVVSNPDETIYQDIFEQAATIGVRTIPLQTHGKPLDLSMLKTQVSDYAERVYYISGPHAMVESLKQKLVDMRIARRNIKTDHFSGY